MNSRQLRALRKDKIARKFAAMASDSVKGLDMSAQLDGLLDAERLADIARNDAAFGIAPPPVERDEEFFLRVDLSMPSAEERERRREHRALQEQINRPDELSRAMGWGPL